MTADATQRQALRNNQLLVVEDEDIYFLFLERSLRKQGLELDLLRARTGLEGLNILKESDTTQSQMLPVILLDLHMPTMSGIEFLRELRSDKELSDAHVFVFTSSDRADDIAACHSQKVSGYIVKGHAASRIDGLTTMLSEFVHMTEPSRRKPVAASL